MSAPSSSTGRSSQLHLHKWTHASLPMCIGLYYISYDHCREGSLAEDFHHRRTCFWFCCSERRLWLPFSQGEVHSQSGAQTGKMDALVVNEDSASSSWMITTLRLLRRGDIFMIIWIHKKSKYIHVLLWLLLLTNRRSRYNIFGQPGLWTHYSKSR